MKKGDFMSIIDSNHLSNKENEREKHRETKKSRG